jgi:hypothetical protein
MLVRNDIYYRRLGWSGLLREQAYLGFCALERQDDEGCEDVFTRTRCVQRSLSKSSQGVKTIFLPCTFSNASTGSRSDIYLGATKEWIRAWKLGHTIWFSTSIRSFFVLRESSYLLFPAITICEVHLLNSSASQYWNGSSLSSLCLKPPGRTALKWELPIFKFFPVFEI